MSFPNDTPAVLEPHELLADLASSSALFWIDGESLILSFLDHPQLSNTSLSVLITDWLQSLTSQHAHLEVIWTRNDQLPLWRDVQHQIDQCSIAQCHLDPMDWPSRIAEQHPSIMLWSPRSDALANLGMMCASHGVRLALLDECFWKRDTLWTYLFTLSHGNILPLHAPIGEASSSPSKVCVPIPFSHNDPSLSPVRSPWIDRIILGNHQHPITQSHHDTWSQAHPPSILGDPKRGLEYASLLYHDRSWERRNQDPKSNKIISDTTRNWSKMGQSINQRPNHSPILQPKVLMRHTPPRAESLRILQQQLQQEKMKPDMALQELKRIRELTILWKSSSLTRRIAAVAQYTPTTTTAQFEWWYTILDIHIEQYRSLGSLELPKNPQSYREWQQFIRIQQYQEVRDQCLAMIVNAAIELLAYEGSTAWESRPEIGKRIYSILEELHLLTLIDPQATGHDPIRFQLRVMGPWMKRDVGAVRDPRSSHLMDDWQIRVLDAIDAYRSCLVVAPTSAGKSFIALHAIQRVLEDPEATLVYVAPTKALVNQVVAEVYSRFSKFQVTGHLLCGVYTRDMRIAPVDCRILVTVPTCLEVLLLAPELAQNWRHQLRWVVFDEVHCIDMAEGAVWGRLLPLIPCPFVALSATIGGIDGFQQWLESVSHAKRDYAHERVALLPVTSQSKPKNKPKMKGKTIPPVEVVRPSGDFECVIHPYRYSDLYTWMVVPRVFTEGSLNELRPLHPWTGLRATQLPSPSNLAPKECLEVYHAMALYAPKDLVASLDPRRWFDQSLLDQKQTRAYEQAIQRTMMEWSRQDPEQAQKVLDMLTGTTLDGCTDVAASVVSLEASLLGLVESMKAQSWIPAIFFNFDPEVCERLAIHLNQQFEAKEESIKQSSDYRQARLRYAEQLKAYEEEKKRQDRTRKRRTKRNDEDLPKDRDITLEEPIDPDIAMVEGTSLTRDGEVEILDDLKDKLKSLKDRGVPHILVDALRRGIGVHHSGLPARYRTTVESYFRSGQVKVVFATETLALGINMPCRSTVFAGDHPRLTPLQYRQMSGRAGRRGYDPLGRVIFWGIPVHRILHLQSSHLAPIRGQFPLSFSFLMRSLILTAPPESTRPVTPAPPKKPKAVAWDDSDSEEEVVRSDIIIPEGTIPIPEGMDTIYHSLCHVIQQSLLQHQSPHRSSDIQGMVQTSLQLALAMGWIDPQGRPQPMAGIIAHLGWSEPSNLLVTQVLMTSTFQEFGRLAKDDWTATSRQMLIVLAHCFSRIPVPQYQAKQFERRLSQQTTRCHHALFLPSLPSSIQQAIDHYQQIVMQIVEQSVSTVPESHRSQSRRVQDPGHGMVEDFMGRSQRLNAYLLDLWVYENYDWLVEYNGIPDVQIYEACKEFLDNLKSLRTVLDHRGCSLLAKAIGRLIREFTKKFNRVFKKFERSRYYCLEVHGVGSYAGDLQKQLLQQIRISVFNAKRLPDVKPREHYFRILCRSEQDRERLIELFDQWKQPNWWIADETSSDEAAHEIM